MLLSFRATTLSVHGFHQFELLLELLLFLHLFGLSFASLLGLLLRADELGYVWAVEALGHHADDVVGLALILGNPRDA